MTNRTRMRLFLAIAVGLMLSACGTTRISRILDDPSRFRNREVRVEGTVTKSVGALVAGLYEVEDGTGKIYVISTGTGVPRNGARVGVSGSVVNGVTLMGRSYGTAIRERHHKVR